MNGVFRSEVSISFPMAIISLFPRLNDLAGIQYVGLSGVSQSCLTAVKRIIQFGEQIENAVILSAAGYHCLLLDLPSDGLVVVKSGFSSGYSGEGPRTFAEVLRLLEESRVEISEIDVPPSLLERVEASALTLKDLDTIKKAKHVRPTRWHDYIYDFRSAIPSTREIWQTFNPIMPWAIIDSRITDLALEFFENPDASILNGFRRLEDIVRERMHPDAQSTRLFVQAFVGDKSRLTWKDVDPGEHSGRGQLFTGVYSAYRNPRAHGESQADVSEMLAEFLLVNQLYRLEATAIERPSTDA